MLLLPSCWNENDIIFMLIVPSLGSLPGAWNYNECYAPPRLLLQSGDWLFSLRSPWQAIRERFQTSLDRLLSFRRLLVKGDQAMSHRGNGKYCFVDVFLLLLLLWKHRVCCVLCSWFFLCPCTFIRRTTGPTRRSTKGNWTAQEVCHTRASSCVFLVHCYLLSQLSMSSVDSVYGSCILLQFMTGKCL
jgi:hypothetical protein